MEISIQVHPILQNTIHHKLVDVPRFTVDPSSTTSEWVNAVVEIIVEFVTCRKIFFVAAVDRDGFGDCLGSIGRNESICQNRLQTSFSLDIIMLEE